MRIRKTLLTFIFLLGVSSASGRDYVAVKTDSGVSLRDVASVRVDDVGFIWASTKLGVVRIASGASKSYTLPIDNSSVRDVKLDCSGGTLYAYLDNGKVFRYDAAADMFVCYVDFGALVSSPSISVYQMLCDVDGNLWVACSMGVLKCTPDKEISSVAFSDNVGVELSMCPDGENILYVCSERGVVKINRQTGTFSPVLGPDARLRATSSLYDSSDGRLWIGTRRDGLFYLDDGSDVLHEVVGMPRYISVRALCKHKDGMIMAGTNGSGLYFVSSSTAAIAEVDRNDADVRESIGANSIRDICCNGSSVLVATYGEGLFYFLDNSAPISLAAHRTKDVNSISNNHVNGVFESFQGKTYVATDNGVDIFDISTHNWAHLYEGFVGNCVFVDSRNRLWIGTNGSGFLIYNLSSQTEEGHFWKSPSDSGRWTLAIKHFFEDQDGDVWILGYNTVILFDHRTGQYRDYAPLTAMSGCVAPDGRICLACYQGLLILDKQTGETEVLCEGVMQDVCSDGSGLWSASSGQGLFHYDLRTKTLSRFTTEHGLNSDFVNSVQFDGGRVWAGTEIGLNSLDLETASIDSFPGFPLLSKSNFNVGAHFIQVNGAHLFGTGDGLLKFHPDQLDRPMVNARMYIEDIRFSGLSVRNMNSIPEGTIVNDIKEVKVKYSHNNFAIDLTAVGSYEGDLKFTWMLDEMDAYWSPPRSTNLCRYTNLKVGRNHFHLRLVDNLGKTVYDSRDLVIVVQPPFWKTWWFILLMTALVLYIAASTWIYQSAKIKSRVVPIINISRASDTQRKNETPEAYDDPFVRKAIEVVNANFQNPDFDKDYFASEMNVSASSLYKKLKALSDQSPTDFIKTIRMTNALNLLQSHKYSVTEVSEMCGYSSPSYFSTAFKNFYGKSPNEI